MRVTRARARAQQASTDSEEEEQRQLKTATPSAKGKKKRAKTKKKSGSTRFVEFTASAQTPPKPETAAKTPPASAVAEEKVPSAQARRPKSSLKQPGVASKRTSQSAKATPLRAHFSGTPGSVSKPGRRTFVKTPHSAKTKKVSGLDSSTKNVVAKNTKTPPKTVPTGEAQKRAPSSTGRPKPKSSLKQPGVASKRISQSAKSTPLRAHFSGTPGSVTKSNRRTFAKTPHSAKTKKVTVADNSIKDASTKESKIPQFSSRRAPDFARLHAQQFDKMESLDDYVVRKKAEKTLSVKRHAAVSRLPPPQPGKDAAKPVASVKPQVKRPSAAGKPFAPTATSVTAANFDFSSRKKSAGAPAGGRPFVFSATPNKALANITNKPGGEAAAGTPGGKKFDLKASLAKGLTYKPHRGKLDNFGAADKKKKKEGVAKRLPPTATTNSKDKAVKQIKGVRLNKRAELLMQRRNLQAK